MSDEEQDLISESITALSNLKQHTLPVFDIKANAEEEDVSEIFVRVNSGGVALKQNDFILTLLSLYEGEPAGGENTFSDVPENEWYTEAVAWAAANGIVNGIGDGRFDPQGTVTREQMATILCRYAENRGLADTAKLGDLSGFPDENRISAYATDAVAWAVGEGLILGSDGMLLPQDSVTRAQVAAILMRFIENIVK